MDSFLYDNGLRHERVKQLYENGCFAEGQYLKICPSGSKPGILIPDKLFSFRPILSSIGTPTWDLAKSLVPILHPLTENGTQFMIYFALQLNLVNLTLVS